MNIRIADIEDLDSLIQITYRCINHLNGQKIFQWDEVYPGKQDLLEDIENEFLFVVNQHSTIQGSICINNQEYPGYKKASWEGNSFYVIHKLMINPESEGKGYGKALMEYAESFAKNKQMDSIRLDCFTQNKRANHFYIHLGYVKKGETIFRKGLFNLYEKMV